MNSNYEDWAVIKRCLKGDKQAYAFIVRKYEKPVFNIACRLIGDTEKARDITQEAFIKAYRTLRQVKPEFKFSNWIFKIATNLCRAQHKKKKPTVKMSLNETIAISNPEINQDNSDDLLDPVGELTQKEEQKIILKTIQSLPFIYRKVIVLRYLQDLSYQEIADILEIPIGRVKVQLHRAHKILRNQLIDVL